MTENYIDNMGFIDEMGGARFSNVNQNIKKYGFKPITLEEAGRLLTESQIIIPY